MIDSNEIDYVSAVEDALATHTPDSLTERKLDITVVQRQGKFSLTAADDEELDCVDNGHDSESEADIDDEGEIAASLVALIPSKDNANMVEVAKDIEEGIAYDWERQMDALGSKVNNEEAPQDFLSDSLSADSPQ